MKKVQLAAFIAVLCLLVSCKVEPEQINYGSDACHFCKMTIVDQQHAAQFVTSKGKQFKYDAIECMVNELSEKKSDDIAILLVADYDSPGQMTSAISSVYLISPAIKSPMGANLSGFTTEDNALAAKGESDGKVYNWVALLKKFDAE